MAWYQINQRELPWRNTDDAYKIWLSEIILQQTRVAQGLPYFEKFVSEFLDIFSLANAHEDKILKLWQGLGYYSRARNMHHTARQIVEKYKGSFPKTYRELRQLKGVGDYTAAAIASFGFKENVPTIDGNVYRVLSRYFGLHTPIDSTQGKKDFKILSEKLIDSHQPDIYNQAVMEFGALQCIPKNPDCKLCPLQESCNALQKNMISQLPVKSKKISPKKRYFNYLIFQLPDNKTLIQKRTQKDIWQHLYQFPLIESETNLNINQISLEIEHLISSKDFEITTLHTSPIVHKLTHQELNINFWEIRYLKNLPDTVTWDKVMTYAFPVIIFEFLKKYLKV